MRERNLAYEVAEVLGMKGVSVVHKDESAGLYMVRIGALKTIVTIRLSPLKDTPYTHFTQSHAIKTPDQDAPYRTSRPWNDYPAAALHQVLDGLLSHYFAATEIDKLQPEESWLVPQLDMISAGISLMRTADGCRVALASSD